MSIRDDAKIGITRKGDDFDKTRLFDPLEFLAELSSHIPNVWEQTTRYYGIYAARTRRSHAAKTLNKTTPLLPDEPIEETPPASKYWALGCSIWVVLFGLFYLGIKKVYTASTKEFPKGNEVRAV